MCQLFGYSGKDNVELNSLLKEFYSHSDRHPNGWGLAVLSGNHANIEREVSPALKMLDGLDSGMTMKDFIYEYAALERKNSNHTVKAG
jgi:predicted glutamine amidotransferase